MKRAYLALAGLLVAALASGTGAWGADYTIIDLGTLGGNMSEGYGVNASGHVAGRSRTADSTGEAFIWDGVTVHDIGSLDGHGSHAYGLNNSDHATGYSWDDTIGANRAFYYNGTTMTDIGTLGGTTAYGYGINSSDEIAGYSNVSQAAGGAPHAFYYDGTTIHDLGTLGGSSSRGFDINDSGYVVGDAGTATSSRAFLYDGTTMHDLGVLPGSTRYSRANGINTHNQVVGECEVYVDSHLHTHAFLWTDGDGDLEGDPGEMIDLGTFGGERTYAYAANSSAQVVGYGIDDSYNYLAFIWESGTIAALNNLIPAGTGWDLRYARDINDAGQITGYGYINSEYHAYLLTPAGEVPEPGTLSLLVVAAALGYRARRRIR